MKNCAVVLLYAANHPTGYIITGPSLANSCGLRCPFGWQLSHTSLLDLLAQRGEKILDLPAWMTSSLICNREVLTKWTWILSCCNSRSFSPYEISILVILGHLLELNHGDFSLSPGAPVAIKAYFHLV